MDIGGGKGGWEGCSPSVEQRFVNSAICSEKDSFFFDLGNSCPFFLLISADSIPAPSSHLFISFQIFMEDNPLAVLIFRGIHLMDLQD